MTGFAVSPLSEWLEIDGLGGFASGTADLIRTRRYHALLQVATTPPTGRVVLVNGFEAWIDTPAGRFSISSQLYGPGVVHPDGASRIEAFEADPWPHWTLCLEDGTRVAQEIFVSRKAGSSILAWKLLEKSAGVSLWVRLFFSGRDSHALHHENPLFRFEPQIAGHTAVWRPYEGIPPIAVAGNGRYSHEPRWYRNFLYSEERSRGLDDLEDLASPGSFCFDLSRTEAILLLSTRAPAPPPEDPLSLARRLRAAERRRRVAFPSRLERSADHYVVRRGKGCTIVAGYPWFTDWGRDTFIAVRGLCLATGHPDTAREILLQWSGMVSEGMLPNRFPEGANPPEYNSVDASLWFIVASHEYLAASERAGRRVSVGDRRALADAVEAILEGYSGGTRFGIRADTDGLLAAGVPGLQLTWMDAKVGDRVVTPRIGKPVEVEALWINALRIGARLSEIWGRLAERASDSFAARFWNEEGFLFDVVDCDGVEGSADASFRPNQIFAVGGLPFSILEGNRARSIVDAVEAKLWTPLGLRSLAPESPFYVGRYEGGIAQRDSAYHQGTVWPWLAGAFVEAWVRVRGGTSEVRREARERFLDPLFRHLDEAGLGHISEIADGDLPHAPRGCPFQAWSLGEALRLDRAVLGEAAAKGEMEPRGRTALRAGR